MRSAPARPKPARRHGGRFGQRAAEYEGLAELYEATRAGGFGDEVKRRIMLGTFALSSGYYEAYYGRAQKVRTKIADDFKAANPGGFDVTTPDGKARLLAFWLTTEEEDHQVVPTDDAENLVAYLMELKKAETPLPEAKE